MWKRCLAFCAACLLTFGLLIIYNMFNGNPVSKYYASKQIQQYIDEHYSDLDIEKVEYKYTFKDSHYYGYVDVKDSEDRDFSVHLLRDGRIEDGYEYEVLGGNNTMNRLFVELKDESDMFIEAYFEDKVNSEGKSRFNFGYLDFVAEFGELPLNATLADVKRQYPLMAVVYLYGELDSEEAFIEEMRGFIEYMGNKGYPLSKIDYSDGHVYAFDIPTELIEENDVEGIKPYFRKVVRG